jgi:D-3-phosphoglycerate dehydrogenase
VLAHVFDHLRADNVNVQEVENVIFDGAEAAVAHINISGGPSPARLQAIQQENPDILSVQLTQFVLGR